MKTVPVHFITHHKVNGGPDDYEREWVAECDIEEPDAYVAGTRIYETEKWEAGERVEVPRNEWPKEIEEKLDKVESRALKFWNDEQVDRHTT